MEGYEVDSAFDGGEALKQIQSAHYDLIILDIMLPSLDGFSITERMRLNNNQTPILILSSIFIAIAFIVNENNAKYLLSGYNTMSEEERMKFDIKSYIPFFRNFHIFLGISLLIISLILL